MVTDTPLTFVVSRPQWEAFSGAVAASDDPGVRCLASRLRISCADRRDDSVRFGLAEHDAEILAERLCVHGAGLMVVREIAARLNDLDSRRTREASEAEALSLLEAHRYGRSAEPRRTPDAALPAVVSPAGA